MKGPAKGPDYHGKQQPPNRPGHGTKGREIVLYANYFSLQLPNKCITVYHYDVTIEPSKLPKIMSRQVSCKV